MPSGGTASGVEAVVCQVRGMVAEITRQFAQVTRHIDRLVDAALVRLLSGLARRVRRQLYGQLSRPATQRRRVARR